MNGDDCFLNRLTPSPALDFRDLTRLGGLDPYGQHRLAWSFFDLPRKARSERAPFLFRAEIADGLPVLYLLSSVPPRDANGKWRIESKPYRPRLAAGQRLAFKLRANPTVARPGDVRSHVDGMPRLRATGQKAGEPRRKVVRHDVVMDAKRQMGWTGLAPDERPTLAHLAHEAGSGWLRAREKRLGCQFIADRLRADGYRVHRMRQRGISLSTLDFEGELVITDPDQFTNALQQGIGPAKAFGCGLLLVRRLAI